MSYHKNPRVQTGFVIIIILIIGWFIFKNPENEVVEPNSNTINNGTEKGKNPESTQTLQTKISGKTWEGILKLSDNQVKGNLMLLTSESKIYLKTKRDFVSLLDKQVVVYYEGDLNNFVLGDIVLK